MSPPDCEDAAFRSTRRIRERVPDQRILRRPRESLRQPRIDLLDCEGKSAIILRRNSTEIVLVAERSFGAVPLRNGISQFEIVNTALATSTNARNG